MTKRKRKPLDFRDKDISMWERFRKMKKRYECDLCKEVNSCRYELCKYSEYFD